MTTLTVCKFDPAEGAKETLGKLVPLQKEHIIEIKDLESQEFLVNI